MTVPVDPPFPADAITDENAEGAEGAVIAGKTCCLAAAAAARTPAGEAPPVMGSCRRDLASGRCVAAVGLAARTGLWAEARAEEDSGLVDDALAPPEPSVSAAASPGKAKVATPIPRDTANAPTLPTTPAALLLITEIPPARRRRSPTVTRLLRRTV